MMCSLQISPAAHEKVKNSVLITGAARSGTTILGKLVHSLEGFEYAFEPPLLYSMFPLIDVLSNDKWRLLYETYLYEDFFLNALSGRNLNFNVSDASSVYGAKPRELVDARLNHSVRKAEAERVQVEHRLAYKIPDIVPFVPRLKEFYPDMTIIRIRREPVETINSLVAKEWFSPANSKLNVIWPFKVVDNVQVPFWVCDSDIALWPRMSEVDRCAYYYLMMNEGHFSGQNQIDIEYGELLRMPRETANLIVSKLGAEFGAKTAEIVDSVEPTNPPRNKEILNFVSADLRGRIENLREEFSW